MLPHCVPLLLCEGAAYSYVEAYRFAVFANQSVGLEPAGKLGIGEGWQRQRLGAIEKLTLFDIPQRPGKRGELQGQGC